MNAKISKIGFWFGIIAFASNVAFVLVQTLQLLGVLKYPFDEIFIYGFSLCIVIPFLMFVTANYVVQLSTVIPMTLRGNADKIKILIQTPHSLFWDFDAIGYISMGIATLFAVPIFKNQGFQRWVRMSFLANAIVTPLIAFVYFYPDFTETILLLGIPWMITAPLSMLLLAIMFKKNIRIKT
jgi:hypothetical protein